jgi:hypothetical protein
MHVSGHRFNVHKCNVLRLTKSYRLVTTVLAQNSYSRKIPKYFSNNHRSSGKFFITHRGTTELIFKSVCACTYGYLLWESVVFSPVTRPNRPPTPSPPPAKGTINYIKEHKIQIIRPDKELPKSSDAAPMDYAI